MKYRAHARQGRKMLPNNHPEVLTARYIERHAGDVMIADYRRLLHDIKIMGNRSAAHSGTAHSMADLQKRFAASRSRLESRKRKVPDIRFSPELPITAKRDVIIDTLRRHQVVIITGETGSGKTTQIPKMCLAAGFGLRGLIGLTQPRRIAAVSIAARIAAELGQSSGEAVSYKIRFEEKTSAQPLIKVMTDGILLAETVHDRDLLAYDTIIVDEAHERSLNIDFLLGYLRTLLGRRKDLKVIITSATIDTSKFAEAFDQAPVIEVSGRMYPVEVRYHPIDPVREEKGETTYVDEVVVCVEKLQQERHFGDILIFLPTEQDIREVCGRLAKRSSGLILPLYARLSGGAQRLVFSPAAEQKIIVATNIAETSLTIPGIKYVIDSGLARFLEYNPRSQTTGLPIKPVSRSSAEQRKGRCGRVQNGICIRLYSREDFADRPLYTTPEILRSNLAGVILRMLALNLGLITSFPFIDRPHPKNIRDGIEILRDLGAIARDDTDTEAERYKLTDIGLAMSRLPLDPRVSRMIIEAEKEGCLNEIAVIAAALSIQDPRERPYDKVDQAQAAHALFQHPESDFLTYLHIWNHYSESLEKMQSQGTWRRFCRDHFLSYRRMREWRDIYQQILEITGGSRPARRAGKQAKIDIDQAIADKIHRSILSGYLSNIAQKKEKNFYTAAKSREVMLYPGSGLFNRGGPWIVAADISLTSRVFARNAANIKSEWLEELGREHCRYIHWAAHWEKNRGQVVALEKVILFGLTIVDQRTVSYDRINPQEAKAIFIREALVEGEVARRLPFLEHNLALWEKTKSVEDKLRKRGIAVDCETIAGLYDRRLPELSDIRTLQKLIKDRGGDDFLRFREEDLIARDPDPGDLQHYPDHIKIGKASLACRYRFEPGKAEDGVTVQVPLGLVCRAASENMERHLPSLLLEKTLHLLKSLPKQARQKLPPVLHIAESFGRQSGLEEATLPQALSLFLSREYQLTVPVDFWTQAQLPDHLNIRYSVIDDRGCEIRTSRDIGELQRDLASEVERTSLAAYRRQWERESVTTWDFGALPESIELTGKHGLTGYAYPALHVVDGVVSLRLFADPREASANQRRGVGALYEVYFAEKLRQLRKNIVLIGEMKKQAADIGNPRHIEQAVLDRVKRDLFHHAWRSPEEFTKHAEAVAPRILPYGQQVMDAIAPVLRHFTEAHDVLEKLAQKNRSQTSLSQFLKGSRQALSELVPVHFPDLYSFDRLRNLPRYIKALAIRAQRGTLNLSAVENKLRDVAVYESQLQDITNRMTAAASEEKKQKVDELYWMIEEYKVSLFAQELKTPYPVSPKRIRQLIDEIEQIVC
ncbi:MAG: ATP-dependent RNA helicase HrpA [Deltaproteobacteria bacterium]|nr:ATP-dependent RNA helicase HrpA [Deltaproteobacteria bacterium]